MKLDQIPVTHRIYDEGLKQFRMFDVKASDNFRPSCKGPLHQFPVGSNWCDCKKICFKH